jgi:hypothetical protein
VASSLPDRLQQSGYADRAGRLRREADALAAVLAGDAAAAGDGQRS